MMETRRGRRGVSIVGLKVARIRALLPTSAANRLIGEVVQSRRRPLLAY